MARILLALLLLVAQDPVETGTAPCRPLRRGADLDTFLAPFETPDKEFTWQLKPVRENEKVARYELTFPSAVKGEVEENNTVHAKYWLPKGDEKRWPAVVVLHWLGGSFEALEIICTRLAEQGVAALMMYMPHYGPRRAKDPEKRDKMITLSMEKTLAHFRQAVLDARRAGDWLASRPDIDRSRIGLVGISLGSIVGAVVVGVDTNFSRCGLIIGGGDIPVILLHPSKEMAEIKAELEKQGLTVDKLREILKPIDPLTFAPRVARESVFMMNAESDEVIPRECTEKLHAALGKPEILWFKGGHYAIATQIGTFLKAVVPHLKKRFRYAAAPNPVRDDVPRIRVLLAEAADSVSIEIKAPFHAFKPKTDIELDARESLAKTTARVEGGKIVVGPMSFEGAVLLVPEESGALQVGTNSYHGSLLLVAAKEGRLHAINVLDLERYVAGVLGPEIGKDAPFEAHKAQAVCARAYAYFEMKKRADELFDVYSDVRDQVYKGVAAKGTWIEKAVAETRGRILMYREKPVCTYFHSTCGGRTESVAEWKTEAETEPLAGTICGSCDGAKLYSWTSTLAAEDIARAFKAKLGGGGVKDVAVKSLTKTGRAKEVTITKTSGTELTVAATEFRATIGYDKFRSTKFTVKREGEGFLFKGNGWGHGVGMCQEGAIGMARANKTCEEILKKYYPGATVRAAYK